MVQLHTVESCKVDFWRITKEAYALDKLGTGASIYGGRWNRTMTPAIYASSSISLCAFEVMVHAGDTLPEDLVVVKITIPDGAGIVDIRKDLTEGWDTLSGSSISEEIGTRHLQERKHLAFMVPSVIIPEESNVVINPQHEDISIINLEILRKFTFDPRLKD